ncbi:MAG: hydroxymethylglutaryl-CoA lyase [Cyclobacteriaceae bacterium]
MVKLIECPRDAMQGLADFIPTFQKIRYLNALLKVGFHTLDFGSFVSPRAVPQMKDTASVLSQLDMDETETRLLAIVANLRGARDAAAHPLISFLGFPLSLSETFQQRNTNQSLDEAFSVVKEMMNICGSADKQLVVYLSMGFGNPYGDPYSPESVAEFTDRLQKMGVSIVSLSDTVGSATNELIAELFERLTHDFPEIEFGAHFHARPENARERIAAAYHAGCRRFDSALRGFGGCPMAKDDLTGNVATESVLDFLESVQEDVGIDEQALEAAMSESVQVFG